MCALQSGHFHLPNLDFLGWNSLGAEVRGDGSPRTVGGRMAEVATAPLSPGFQRKQVRLYQFLDKLRVRLPLDDSNDFFKPASPWLMVDQIKQSPPVEDVPLDLSIKSEPPKPQPKAVVYSCGACGQTFDAQDRLAKHIASRHRGRTPDAVRAYECDVCQRRFARSDMLTRHARLHSGIKPYACSICTQVFSRSDHLATHQRTHTGEKPYRCPECPYAACRRDMITRHMRTHTKRGQAA